MCTETGGAGSDMERNKRLQELTASLSSELRGLTDTEESHVRAYTAWAWLLIFLAGRVVL